jgi:uroporphyrinogen decarboxylase
MALHHEEPDRCPMQISFTPEFASRLKDDLGLTDEDFHNPHGGGNTYVLERAVDEDLILTSVGWANSYYATEVYSEDGVSYTDEWGVGWTNVEYETRFGKGHYTEILDHPLADDNAIDWYQPPDPNRPELYVEAERVIKEYKDEYWIVGVTVTTIFETAWALRGYEKTLMDFVVNPDFVEKLFDIPFDYHLFLDPLDPRFFDDIPERIEKFSDRFRVFQTGFSLWERAWTMRGWQNLMMDFHDHPDFVNDLVNCFNPFQPEVMDVTSLIQRYRGRLAFHGGLSTQRTLPYGSSDDARRETETLLELGRDGGYIFAPAHDVEGDVPLENMLAFIEIIQQQPGYVNEQ